MSYDSQTKIANDQHFDKTFTVEYQGVDASDVIVLTPSTGKKLAVKGYVISPDATTGHIRLYFSSDESGNENTITMIHPAGYVGVGYVPTLIKGAVNEPIKMDVSGVGGAIYIMINYKEE